MNKKLLSLAVITLGLSSWIGSAKAQYIADTFGSGANQFTLDFTTVGNTNQAADPATGYGNVPYNYAMGAYTVSQNQLDVAAANGLQGVPGGAYSGDQPASDVSWYQAAAFVNWLNTSKGYSPAYDLTYSGGSYSMSLWQSGQSGYDPSNPFRNSQAVFVLPSVDEYYKAAFGLADGSGYTLYADGSNTVPTAVPSGTNAGTAIYNQTHATQPSSVTQAGGLSSYGTMGQVGNIFLMTETSTNGVNTNAADPRIVRGAFWNSPADVLPSTYSGYYGDVTATNLDTVGFSVAKITANAVPEPTTYALLGVAALALVIAYRRKVS
jgi:hypothetical protein